MRACCCCRRAARADPPSARLLRQGGQVAADLDLLGSGEAAQARLLAGRLAGALGRQAEADAHLPRRRATGTAG